MFAMRTFFNCFNRSLPRNREIGSQVTRVSVEKGALDWVDQVIGVKQRVTNLAQRAGRAT